MATKDKKKINDEDIKMLEKQIEKKKEEQKNKKYTVEIDSTGLSFFKDYINNKIKWTGKEALGVIEMEKEISVSEIKDGYILLSGLVIQASHFFLTRETGKGLQEAKNYISLLKAFENSLSRVNKDSKEIMDLEMELTSMTEGIEIE